MPIRPTPGGMPAHMGELPKEEGPIKIDNLEPLFDYVNLECLNADPKTPLTNALKQDNDILVVK